MTAAQDKKHSTKAEHCTSIGPSVVAALCEVDIPARRKDSMELRRIST